MSDFIGWVSIHRKIIDSPIYKDSQAVHLWIHLLISANHKDNCFLHNGKMTTVKRGQFLTGRQALSSATGIHESKIQRLLVLFEDMKMIEQHMNSKSRYISITNYDLYQVSEQQVNNTRTTGEQQVNTNNNVNNENNENNIITNRSGERSLVVKKAEKVAFTTADLISVGVDESIARDFMEVRKRKKSPLTETALKGIVRESELAGYSINQALQICAERGWQSFKAEWVTDKQTGRRISFYELATGKRPEF